MFAKLLAELKRIAILLQSKKLVDKDYVPDEGGESETDDKTNDLVVITYLVYSDLTQKGITGLNYKIRTNNYNQIFNSCLASDLFTTEGINAINAAITSFKNDMNTFGVEQNDYYIGDTNGNQNVFIEAFEREPNFTLTRAANLINISIDSKHLVATIDYTSGVLEENTRFTDTRE